MKLVILLGVFCYAMGTYGTLSSIAAVRSAVPVQARVLSHNIVQDTDGDGGDSYRPQIEFEFEYEGTSYTGSHFRYRTTFGLPSRGFAQANLDRYPIGSNVTAHVPPSEPAEAFLIAEPSIIPMIFVFIGLCMVNGILFLHLLSTRGPLERPFKYYYSLWPGVMLIAGLVTAIPWTSVVDGPTLSLVAVWAVALLSAAAPVLFAFFEQRRLASANQQ